GEDSRPGDRADPDVARTFRVNGSSRSQGVEASLSADVSDRLAVGMAYAYTDAESLEGSLYPFRQIPNVPYNSGNVYAQMQWDAHWRSGLNIYAQGDRYADQPNTTVLPAYATVDLVQAYAFTAAGHPLELQLNIRNLFDEAYFAASHLHFTKYIMPGEGRNVSVSMMYRF
ncbi:TonB-dependent receptor domain-containing protein, partial [Hyphomonas beringensis]|uniref:TonB-dependent receptor domain-containing protein n=1 Tax=Hyphomonas beringensis TaxID=1280946 RepID=UPI00054DEC3B